MDAVKVKISEEYKPPPKINMLMTHTQRLTFNKQIEENLPKYDFSMENNVLQKIREWKCNRTLNEKQRQMRLQTIKDKEEAEEKETEEETSPESNDVPSTSYENETIISSVGPNYTYSNGMLLPTQVTNYSSSILQPIPLKSDNQNFSNSLEIKSPFNISEFEADTSSPFDNVALKSINDVEELAKVLKLDDIPAKHSTIVSYSNLHSNSNPQTHINYTGISNFVPTSSFSNHSSNTGLNGYYNCDIQSVKTFPTNYQCSPPLNNYLSSYSNHFTHQQNMLADNEKCNKLTNFSNPLKHTQESRGNVANKQNGPVFVRKSSSAMNLPDPFDELPKHLQDMSRNISSMGFPLPRVARTCKAIGDDNKKIVDHLLAMSELLDLGFAEDKISEALMLYDNDRDKALDKLIS
ncbi:hypothetical protein HHI36_012029 [Cryptolaemus montrouzieri]|uniref:Ubiquitin-associated protein 1 n=1 Tax=Cryptolaemus montrouzieri TaxID=559131 RepID=A0ABD2NDK4_9CUCU